MRVGLIGLQLNRVGRDANLLAGLTHFQVDINTADSVRSNDYFGLFRRAEAAGGDGDRVGARNNVDQIVTAIVVCFVVACLALGRVCHGDVGIWHDGSARIRD